MISEQSIRKVKESVDIVEVVSDYLNLKKKGKDFWAPCPFHSEKTPSFSVSPTKGIYKCFGCGAAGDSIKFVMEIERISYIEAIKTLAKKYNIELEEVSASTEKFIEHSLVESIYIALNFAKNFYTNQLWNTEQGKAIALSYLRERGFSVSTIQKFELGYAPDSWDSLYQEARKNKFSDDILQKSGLITVNENGKKYDRFRGRVIFPIHSVSGKTLAFGARILKQDKSQPKYINTNETEVYVKGNVLYGLYQAKNAIRIKDKCYLVEGYTDVIAMHEAGVENVVASLGTSLTHEQSKLILRFTKHVTILYDGDEAGIKASFRGINLLLEHGLNVKVCTFPDGHDPDSYAKLVGSEAFLNYLTENEQDFIHFKTSILLKHSKDDPIAKAHAVKEIVETIAVIPDSILKNYYIKECSYLLNISEELLIAEVNKLVIQHHRNSVTQDEKQILNEILEKNPHASNWGIEYTKDPVVELEKELLRLLINYAHLKNQEGYTVLNFFIDYSEDIDFEEDTYGKILLSIREKGEQQIEFILNEKLNELVDIIHNKNTISNHWEVKGLFIPKKDENPFKAMLDTLYRLKLLKITEMIISNQERLRNENNLEQIDKLLNVAIFLKNRQKEIANKLGIVILR